MHKIVVSVCIVVLNLVGFLDREHAGIYLLVSGGCALLLIIESVRGQFPRRRAVSRTESVDSSPTLSGHLLTIQEEERRRLSRELHDGVGQTVTALKMELARVQPADPESGIRLERARLFASETLQTIRNVSSLLRPTILDDLGLHDALQWHTEEFARRTSIECRLQYEVDSDDILPDTVRTCVYRTVQEALNNCEKHASAKTVIVRVMLSELAVIVEIEDDGQGGAGTPRHPSGLGILGMRERAAMSGGALQIDSIPGTGTTVTLSIPRGKEMQSAKRASEILHR